MLSSVSIHSLIVLPLLPTKPPPVDMISTALRTGIPLPQVTPCPLLDRFVAPKMGLHFLKGDESTSPDSNNEAEDAGEESDVYGEESE